MALALLALGAMPSALRRQLTQSGEHGTRRGHPSVRLVFKLIDLPVNFHTGGPNMYDLPFWKHPKHSLAITAAPPSEQSDGREESFARLEVSVILMAPDFER